MAASIIAIGNPGSGKSTVLNCLAGEVLFKSGMSIGDGLTYQLDERENARGRFYDTPGLADDTHREAAAKAISTALRKGGYFRVLFFIMANDGRVVKQDITTLRLVLDAAPEIGNHYGIVINKQPDNVAKALRDPSNESVFLTKLFNGIPENQRCAKSNIAYLPFKSEFQAADNKLLDLKDLTTIKGELFRDFIYDQVPRIGLTVDKAGDIAIHEFEQMTRKLETLQAQMEQDRKIFQKQQNLLMDQLKRAEEEKKEYQRRDKELHAKQMAMLQRQIDQRDKEFRVAKEDADRRARFQADQAKMLLEQQRQQLQAQQSYREKEQQAALEAAKFQANQTKLLLEQQKQQFQAQRSHGEKELQAARLEINQVQNQLSALAIAQQKPEKRGGVLRSVPIVKDVLNFWIGK